MKISVFGMAIVASLLVSSLTCAGANAGGKSSDRVTLDYDILVGLPYNARISYLEAFRNVLLEMDSDHLGSHAALDWMLDQILCSAEAHPNDPFCINLGVVREAASCPDEFHNFDTGKYFKSIGLTTADPICAEGGLPCSPYFGFDKSGNLYCSKTNRTKSCEKKSEDKSTIQLADVLKKCALQGSSVAKIDCNQLPQFMANQQTIVDQYCKDSHRACGILRDQTDKDAQMFKDINANPDEGQIAKINAYLNQVNAQRPVTAPVAKCPPEAAPATQPAPEAASNVSPTAQSVQADAQGLAPPAEVKHQDCNDKRDMKGSHIATEPEFMEIWDVAFPQGSAAGCVQFKTPSGFLLTLNKKAGGIAADGLIEFPAGTDGKPSRPPVSLNVDSFRLMAIMSQVFESKSFTIDPAKLLQRYLPVTPIKQSGIIQDGNKNYPALEYTTEDGTTIRYTEDADWELVTLKPNGGTESAVLNFPLKK